MRHEMLTLNEERNVTGHRLLDIVHGLSIAFAIFIHYNDSIP